jgi:tRNA-uridine 2-sulfurtransferase
VNVLVAMSGGVDSSIAAARLVQHGHEVTGVTLRLWGGESDSGCCSVSDVDDARRVSQQLGIDHLVFNFGDDFGRDVVGPYVADHAAGRTPNPCVECNRHLKFDRLLRRAAELGFDAMATGHHARVVRRGDHLRIARGVDEGKDQSYVLYVLGQHELSRLVLPVGDMTKHEVRAEAARLGLRTAGKPDSQDVCFITSTGGREAFLGSRIGLRRGRVVDTHGRELGEVANVELVTVGQRRGLQLAGAREPRYALDVDLRSSTVVVGSADELLVASQPLERVVWAHRPVEGSVVVQCSAHGRPRRASVERSAARPTTATVHWREQQRRVAPGQSVVFYDDDEVVGGGIAC